MCVYSSIKNIAKQVRDVGDGLLVFMIDIAGSFQCNKK